MEVIEETNDFYEIIGCDMSPCSFIRSTVMLVWSFNGSSDLAPGLSMTKILHVCLLPMHYIRQTADL